MFIIQSRNNGSTDLDEIWYGGTLILQAETFAAVGQNTLIKNSAYSLQVATQMFTKSDILIRMEVFTESRFLFQ